MRDTAPYIVLKLVGRCRGIHPVQVHAILDHLGEHELHLLSGEVVAPHPPRSVHSLDVVHRIHVLCTPV